MPEKQQDRDITDLVAAAAHSKIISVSDCVRTAPWLGTTTSRVGFRVHKRRLATTAAFTVSASSMVPTAHGGRQRLPEPAALERLADAILAEAHEEWNVQDKHRYLSEASMTELYPTSHTTSQLPKPLTPIPAPTA